MKFQSNGDKRRILLAPRREKKKKQKQVLCKGREFNSWKTMGPCGHPLEEKFQPRIINYPKLKEG